MDESSAPSKNWRFLSRDGTFNVERSGMRRNAMTDLYHGLLSVSWPRFMVGILSFYLGLNFIFALLYFMAGDGALDGVPAGARFGRFWECYFFSVQTLATIGYGRISPVSFFANSVMTLEAFVGMTVVAIWTGLAFARFSRPTAKVIFSKKAVMTKIDGQPCFIFRMANARLNQIVEANVSVVLGRTETTQEGETYRNLYDLTLERSMSPMFVLSWTVVHPIDEKSPFWGQTPQSLEESQTEVLISLRGTDGTLSQMVHTRYSYVGSDIVWNGRFKDMLEIRKTKNLVINLGKIDEMEMPAVNPS